MLQPKLLGCIGNQILLPMVLRGARFNSRARAPLSKELLLGVFTEREIGKVQQIKTSRFNWPFTQAFSGLWRHACVAYLVEILEINAWNCIRYVWKLKS